jgi:uncharacterized linocin/CFP29 family protein
MNSIRYVGTVDNALTTEQGQYISAQVKEAARRAFKGRQLFGSSIRKIDSGAQTYGYDTLTHGSAAAFDYTYPGKQSLDAVNLTRSTVAIPNIHKEFHISKLDLASSRMSGTPLNTTQAESSAYKVAYGEDSMLINGWSQDGTTYEINGLYRAAGNTKAGSDWATNTNIPATITGAIDAMIADNIDGPYNVTLATEQYGYALGLISNTAVSYLQWIQQAVGGSVQWSPVLTAGTGLMTKADPAGAFEYVVAEDITTVTETESVKDGEGLFGRVYLRALPVVYDSNAICTLTGLT